MAGTAIANQSNTGALATERPKTLAERWNMDPERIELIRSTCIAADAPDSVLELYLEKCKIIGCEPTSKMLYCIGREANVVKKDERGNDVVQSGRKVWVKDKRWTFQTGIDLFRSIADSQHDDYAGQKGPFFTDDGVTWVEGVWLKKTPPAACKIGVLRHKFTEPLWAYGTYEYFVQKDREGNPTAFWKGEKGAHQLAKCVEALALRKAFPQKLAGIYTFEEMQQADNEQAALPTAAGRSRSRAVKPVEAIDAEHKALPAPEAAAESEHEALPPAPQAGELNDRYKKAAAALDTPLNFAQWLRNEGIVDLSTRPKVDGRYHLTDDERREADAKLQALELQAYANEKLGDQKPPEAEEAQFTEEPPQQGSLLEVSAARAYDEDGYGIPCEECIEANTGGGYGQDCTHGPGKTGKAAAPHAPAPSTKAEAASHVYAEQPEGTSSKAQRAKIALMCKDLEIDEDERHRMIFEKYGPKWSAKHLDKPEANAFIDQLDVMLKAAAAE